MTVSKITFASETCAREYRNLSGVELDAKKYEPGDLHWLHKAISNLKAFLLGTYHGR